MKYLIILLLSFSFFVSFSQQISSFVEGKVYLDNVNTPSVGANITIAPFGAIGITNRNGIFRIRLSNVDTVGHPISIIVSYLGYDSIKKNIIIQANETSITPIVLKKNIFNIGNVVVSSAIVNRSERSLSYVNTSIAGNNFTTARNANVADGLEGHLTGVAVTPSGAGATGSVRIIVRGVTSINPASTNQPLYVVDGIPIDNTNYQPQTSAFNGFNLGDGIQVIAPDEIESFTVLKDAASTAIYGYRSAGGVILITSKKGGGVKGLRVEVNSNSSIETPLIIPRWQTQYGQGQNGVAPTSTQFILNSDISSWGAKINGQPVIQYDGVYRPYTAQTNNYGLFYRVGSTFTNSVTLNAGDNKNNVSLVVTDLRNQSVIPNSSLTRTNFSLHANMSPVNHLDIAIILKYIQQQVTNRPIVGDSPGNPNYVISLGPTTVSANVYKNATYTSTGAERPFNINPYVENPYWTTNQYIENDQISRWIAGLTPTYHITPWLDIRGKMSLDYYTFNIFNNIPIGTTFAPQGQYGNTTGANLLPQNTRYTEYNGELLVRAKKRFLQDKIGIDAFIAGNNQINNIAIQQIYSPGLIATIPFYDISNAASPVITNNNIKYSVNSIYGSIGIDYKQWAYLTFTGRNDWFSTLAVNKNSSFYPSIGGDVILTSALRLPTFINFAKISSSYGIVGSTTTPYQLNLQYAFRSPYNSSLPVISYNNTTIPNNALIPFTVNTFDIALEAKFLNDIVGGSIDFYNKNTNNDIVLSNVSYTTGFATQIQNIGKVLNQGVEATVYGKPFQIKNFSWVISYNVSYNQNRVINLSSNSSNVESITVYASRDKAAFIQNVVGLPAGQLVVSDFARDAKGNVIYNQGIPQISNNLINVGTVNPPVIMGLQNEFTWRNFDMSFLIDGKFGAVIYSTTNSYGNYYGKTNTTLTGRVTGIIGTGVNANGTPNATRVTSQQFFQSISGVGGIGALNVFSADFVKLRQIIVGYTIPNALLKRARIRQIRVSLAGRNIGFLYKVAPNIDPEANVSIFGQGVEYIGVPSVASVSFNVNLKF